MKRKSTARRIAAAVAAITILTALTAVAEASTARPAGMTKAEYRAIMLRSEALNRKYRLGEWKGVPAGMTIPQYRALMVRSEGLNKKYGLGRWASPAAAQQTPASAQGFAWGAFGIGAAAMLGVLLLAGGAVASKRTPRDPVHLPST